MRGVAFLLAGVAALALVQVQATAKETGLRRAHRVANSAVQASVEPQPRIADLLLQVSEEGRGGASDPVRAAARLRPDEESALIDRCAPKSPREVIRAVIAVESGSRPWLLSVNGRDKRVIVSPNAFNAAEAGAHLREQHADFDVGLMQLNVRTLARLGVSVAAALEPCRNIQIGAKLLEDNYARALAAPGATIPLMAAYSAYNTGDLHRGYATGYADQVAHHLRAAHLATGASS